MSLFKSTAETSQKDHDLNASQKAKIDLVDIGEPLAKIVRENNNKAVQDYWRSQERSQEGLSTGFV
jgi:hypothetical protein